MVKSRVYHTPSLAPISKDVHEISKAIVGFFVSKMGKSKAAAILCYSLY